MEVCYTDEHEGASSLDTDVLGLFFQHGPEMWTMWKEDAQSKSKKKLKMRSCSRVLIRPWQFCLFFVCLVFDGTATHDKSLCANCGRVKPTTCSCKHTHM